MAKNREPVKPVESESESGEEEEEEASSEEEEGSDSEPELTQPAKKAPISTPAPLKKAPPQPQPQPAASSGDEESGSESESDSDGDAPKVKPLASKPMDVPEKPKDGGRKPRSKSVNSEVATPVKSTAGKRPAEEKEAEGKDAKKAKKKGEPETSEKKSNLFQRLWSEDDEIEVLKGMIDYAAKKNRDPVADVGVFHELIKKNLHVDASRTQLLDKIRRLKKKYLNNKSKEKEGKDRTFTNPHEQKAYELSKKVWGGGESGKENGGGEKAVGSPKANGGTARKVAAKKGNVVESEGNEVKTLQLGNGGEKERGLAPTTVVAVDYFGHVSMEGRVNRLGAELFESGKGIEEEKVWEKLKMEEMDAYRKLMDVKSRQASLVFDYVNSEER